MVRGQPPLGVPLGTRRGEQHRIWGGPTARSLFVNSPAVTRSCCPHPTTVRATTRLGSGRKLHPRELARNLGRAPSFRSGRSLLRRTRTHKPRWSPGNPSTICGRLASRRTGRWISFLAVTREAGRRLCRPEQRARTARATDWTCLTDPRIWTDKPRWSSDGKLLYVWRRHGSFFNVWALPFDDARGTVAGAPVQVTHFDSPAHRIWADDLSLAEPSVVGNQNDSARRSRPPAASGCSTTWTGEARRGREALNTSPTASRSAKPVNLKAVRPMLATSAVRLPEGQHWSYEVKWDGYRTLAVKDGARVTLLSRNLKDATAQSPGSRGPWRKSVRRPRCWMARSSRSTSTAGHRSRLLIPNGSHDSVLRLRCAAPTEIVAEAAFV